MASVSVIPSLSATCICPVTRSLSLRQRMFARDAVTSFQAIWRGYRTRKSLKIEQDEEFQDILASWEKLDEIYRLCAMCQSVLVDLYRNDPTWDAESTSYYQAMLTEGRALEQLEIYLQRRGWKRPVPKPLPKTTVRIWLKEALELSC